MYISATAICLVVYPSIHMQEVDHTTCSHRNHYEVELPLILYILAQMDNVSCSLPSNRMRELRDRDWCPFIYIYIYIYVYIIVAAVTAMD